MELPDFVNQYTSGYREDSEFPSILANEKDPEVIFRFLLRQGPKTASPLEAGAPCARNLAARLLRRQFARDLLPFLDSLIRILDETPNRLKESNEELSHEWNLLAENVCRVLAEIGPSASPAVPSLLQLMHASQREFGEWAACALGEIGGRESILALNEMWYAGWDRKCYASCLGAWNQLHEQAFPVLLERIENEQGRERARALLSLEAAAYPREKLVRLALRLLRDDEQAEVREAAASLLQQPESAIPACPYLHLLHQIERDDTRSDSARWLAAQSATRVKAHLDEPPQPRRFGRLGCSQHELAPYSSLEFFRWMTLERQEDVREGVVSFRPRDSAYRDLVSLEIRFDGASQILNVRLHLDDRLIHENPIAYAADILHGFLTTSLSRPEQASLGSYQSHLKDLLLGEEIRGSSHVLFGPHPTEGQRSVKHPFLGGSLHLIHGGEGGSENQLTFCLLPKPSPFWIEAKGA